MLRAVMPCCWRWCRAASNAVCYYHTYIILLNNLVSEVSWYYPDAWSNWHVNVVLGVRKYGTDFSAIAEVIGNKTLSHVQNFFITYRQQFRLDDMLHDNEHDLSSVRNSKIIKHTDAQPPEVCHHFSVPYYNISFYKCCLMEQTYLTAALDTMHIAPLLKCKALTEFFFHINELLLLTTCKAAWYVILILSVCICVCQSDDNFGKLDIWRRHRLEGSLVLASFLSTMSLAQWKLTD